MTEFQLKRLNYFIKEAKKSGWVQLAPGDAELFIQQHIDMNTYNDAYHKGYEEGLNVGYDQGYSVAEDLTK